MPAGVKRGSTSGPEWLYFQEAMRLFETYKLVLGYSSLVPASFSFSHCSSLEEESRSSFSRVRFGASRLISEVLSRRKIYVNQHVDTCLNVDRWRSREHNVKSGTHWSRRWRKEVEEATEQGKEPEEREGRWREER